MKKVIAILPEGEQILTTSETAKKNNWWITYNLDVQIVEGKYQHAQNSQLLPEVGMMMTGINGFIYQIATVTPVHICFKCHETGKNRVGNKFYCTRHFNHLVVTKPIVKNNAMQNRNEPCSCGSGKKFKHCCQPKATDHKARHYFNSEYVKAKPQPQKTA